MAQIKNASSLMYVLKITSCEANGILLSNYSPFSAGTAFSAGYLSLNDKYINIGELYLPSGSYTIKLYDTAVLTNGMPNHTVKAYISGVQYNIVP